MIIVYILIGIVLIVAAVYWMRLEKNKVEDDVADKVEPDLHSLFDETPISKDESLEHKDSSQPSEATIDHDDLAYRPKSQEEIAPEPVQQTMFSEPVEEVLAEPEPFEERSEESHKKEGFLQKISGLFRGKQSDMAVYSDDGNLMRPAAVETIALILSAAPDQPYSFKEVLTVAHELNLQVENGGFIQLLTTTHYGDEPMYSIGHLLGDGTFDENLVRHHLDDTTPGLIFFSKIPGPDPDISTIEQLLAGIHHFSSVLGGKILDSNQRVMSKDDLIALFHKTNKLDSEEWEKAYEAYETRNRE
ncbi:cell division protein ZipA C-terminal FtsZ-binding domain-containing protein [Ignatzschineria sp. LJL83]